MPSRRHLFALCLPLALAACLPGSAKPEGVVRGFVRAVERQDMERALAFCDLSTLPPDGPEKMRAVLLEMSTRMGANGGLKDMDTMLSTPREAMARVQVKLTFHNNSTSRDNFNLREKDGAWKIILDDFAFPPG